MTFVFIVMSFDNGSFMNMFRRGGLAAKEINICANEAARSIVGDSKIGIL